MKSKTRFFNSYIVSPLFFSIFIALISSAGCRKSSSNVNQLPPATQTGSNTFGAMVNGTVWVPKGFNGTANLSISYDPGYANGTLNIAAYRILDTVSFHSTALGFYIDSLNFYKFPHTFLLKSNSNNDLGYTGYPCEYNTADSLTYSEGSIIITKLDLQKGIISGTFSGMISKSSCPSVTITDGRFDMKLN